jgi:hypothetical protein
MQARLHAPLRQIATWHFFLAEFPRDFPPKDHKTTLLAWLQRNATLSVGRLFRSSYLLYFSQPKQSKTRESRVEKYMHQILKGKGLDD